MTLLTCVVFVHLLAMTVQQERHQQTGQHDDVTEEVDCDERDSCSYSDDHRRNCYCDSLCRIYDDCCPDSDVIASDVMTPGRALHASCQRLPDVIATRHDDAEFYVVSRCASSYGDADVTRRCRLHTSNNAVDQFYRIPVVIRSDPLRRTYRNVYCAACASHIDATPTFYDVKVKCRSLPDSASVSVSELLRSSSSCRVVFLAPSSNQSVMSPRTCRSHISRCDRRWADTTVIDRCRRASLSYVYAGMHVFRNRHCARCNYVNDTYVSCDVTTWRRSVGTAADLDGWTTAAVIDLNRRRSVFSYVTNERHHRQAVYDLPQCQQQHIFDPFAELCRRIPSLQLSEDHLKSESQRQDVISSSVAVVNASGLTYEFHLYVVKTEAERLTALLACIVSMLSLVVVVVVYTVRPAARAHLSGKLLLGVVVTLLAMQLLYVLAVPLVDVVGRASVTCFCIHVALHYASLTSLCWLNALAINSVGNSERCGFTCCCVCASTAALPVVISMLMLSVLRLDGSDGGASCWTLGLSQLMLHTMMLCIALIVNCIACIVAVRRRQCLVTGPVPVSMLLTLIVTTDAALTVVAAVGPRATAITYISLAMHAALGPLVCLSTLLPHYLTSRSSQHNEHVCCQSPL